MLLQLLKKEKIDFSTSYSFSFFKVDFVRKEKNDDMGFLWQVVSIKLLPPDDLLTNLTEGLHYYTYHTTYDTQKKNR